MPADGIDAVHRTAKVIHSMYIWIHTTACVRSTSSSSSSFVRSFVRSYERCRCIRLKSKSVSQRRVGWKPRHRPFLGYYECVKSRTTHLSPSIASPPIGWILSSPPSGLFIEVVGTTQAVVLPCSPPMHVFIFYEILVFNMPRLLVIIFTVSKCISSHEY